MLLSNKKSKPHHPPPITTLQGCEIQSVSEYKYLGFKVDDSLNFKPIIQQLTKKTETKTGFLFQKYELILL